MFGEVHISTMSNACKGKEKNDLKDLKISILESENEFLVTVVDTLKKGLHNIKLEYDFLLSTVASFESQQELKHLHKSINVTQFGPLNYLSLPPTPESNPLLSLPKIPASPYPSPKVTPLITPDDSPLSPYTTNYISPSSPIIWGGEEDSLVDAIACSQDSSNSNDVKKVDDDKEDFYLYVRYVNRQKPILDMFLLDKYPISRVDDYTLHNVDWRHKLLFNTKDDLKNFYNKYKKHCNGDITLYTFDFLSFKNSCHKKHVLFLNNLKSLSKDNFKTQMFLFSTLFTLCDLLTKFKVLQYEISFTNISIYSEKFVFYSETSPFNYMQLRHTKKYFSYEDAVLVRAYFDGLNIFEHFN